MESETDELLDIPSFHLYSHPQAEWPFSKQKTSSTHSIRRADSSASPQILPPTPLFTGNFWVEGVHPRFNRGQNPIEFRLN